MIVNILTAQSQAGYSNEDCLILIHLHLGHSKERIAQDMDISLVRASHRIAYIEQEDLLNVQMSPISNSSAERLSKIVEDTLKSTAPKTPRKPAKLKSPKAKANNNYSPLEVAVEDWSPTHLLKYFEIRWCEQSWKTPPPRWQVKDRANAKRVLETYSEKCKDLLDYYFDNWAELQKQFNIKGLPNISILWGFRDSIAPQAFGDVKPSDKSWGSSHDHDEDRKDGDELGW